jgi:cellulose binding protein with CBM2 domain
MSMPPASAARREPPPRRSPTSSPRRRRGRAAWLAAVTALASGLVLAAAQVPASGLNVSGTPAPVTGNATWFSSLGSPYGGCGLPQADLDSQNFLALNVQNSPGSYADLPRPIPAADAAEIGMFDNGLNCGRWVQVTIGNYCTGTNDGAPGEPFCRNGSWVADGYNGATLDFVVADSCDDGNAWCKDDPYHVDLAQASLNQFVLGGRPVGNMYPDHWNNRQVSWQFIPAPGYTGDLRIGAIQGAQPYWPAIAISHLPDGINGVQFLANGTWSNAQMDADMGDDYIIGPTTGAGTNGTQYQIRVIDASGNLVDNGEVYSFTLPAGCATGCSAAYTPISYATSPGGGPSPSPSPSGPPTTSPSPSPGPTPPGGCALTASVVNSWPGGYQVQLVVANHGAGTSVAWTAGLSFADSAGSVASAWNATVSQSGTQVSAASVSYNGAIPPGGTVTWGMVVNGGSQALTGLSCALR